MNQRKKRKEAPHLNRLKLHNNQEEVITKIKQIAAIKNELFLLKKRLRVKDSNFNIPGKLIKESSAKSISGLLLLHIDIPMEFTKAPKKIWLYLNKEGRIGLFSLETDDNGLVYWTNTQWKIESPVHINLHQESFRHNNTLHLIDERFDKTAKMLVNNGFNADPLKSNI